MKKVFITLLVLLLIAAAGGAGFYYGANKVRNGLVANYPTVKNLVQGAFYEKDSVVTAIITKAEHPEISALLNTTGADTAQISIPYYGRYGIDLAARNFRLFKTDNSNVEISLPPVRLLYCELKFDRMSLNGQSATPVFKTENTAALKSKLYEWLIPVLEKEKNAQKQTKTVIAKPLMYYFIPYKWNLELYIAEQRQELPILPGVNQTVDEAINQMLGK